MNTFATFYAALDYAAALELAGYEAVITPQGGGFVVVRR